MIEESALNSVAAILKVCAGVWSPRQVPERLRPDGFNLDAKLNKAIPTAEDNLHTAIQLVDGSTAQTLNPTTKLASLDLRELELLLVTTPPSWAYKRRGSEGSSTKRLKFSRGMSAAFVTIIPC